MDSGHQTGPHLGPMRTHPSPQDLGRGTPQTHGSVATPPHKPTDSETETGGRERPKAQKSFIGEFRPIRDTLSKPSTPEHPAPAWDSLQSNWPCDSDSLKTQRLLGAPKPGEPLPASHQLAFLSENLPISPGAIERSERFPSREEIISPHKRQGDRQKDRLTNSAREKKGSLPIFSSSLLGVKRNLFVGEREQNT